jgi:hypothetical protein
MRRLALAVLLGLCATGCFRTSVYAGVPPGRAVVENHWHSGFLGGLIETSGPYDLSKTCPGGWAELYVKTGFGRLLVQYLTMEIYTPQNVSIVCAAPGVRGPAPASGYPMPAPPPASSAYPPPASSRAIPPPQPVPLHREQR